MLPASTNFDVLVIGAGPVGGLLACALAEAGLAVAIIEAAPPAVLARPGGDGRAIAVALSAQRAMAATGVWPHLASEAQRIDDIRVTDGAAPVFLHYDHRTLGDEPFGWIVEGSVIRRGVLARLAELPVQLFAPARVASFDFGGARATAHLADGRSLSAALVVAADGRASSTRQAAGIGVTGWDYPQSGIVCTVAHQRPHRGIAHEHFLPAGPFAILPMARDGSGGDRSGVVWTERRSLAPAIVGQDDDAFLAELHSRFGDFLGEMRLAGPRLAHPLSLQFADAITGPRLALVGDAAHGMHPIAGQGMNMGVRDVAALAQCLVEAGRLGLDVGAATVLERWRRWRRFDTLLMLGMTDGLNRLFSNDLAPVRLARGLGLAAVQRLPGLKRLFMRHAMGVVGDLPKLLKGERV